MNILKIVGVACFNAVVGMLFIFFYKTNMVFSLIVPQV